MCAKCPRWFYLFLREIYCQSAIYLCAQNVRDDFTCFFGKLTDNRQSTYVHKMSAMILLVSSGNLLSIGNLLMCAKCPRWFYLFFREIDWQSAIYLCAQNVRNDFTCFFGKFTVNRQSTYRIFIIKSREFMGNILAAGRILLEIQKGFY